MLAQGSQVLLLFQTLLSTPSHLCACVTFLVESAGCLGLNPTPHLLCGPHLNQPQFPHVQNGDNFSQLTGPRLRTSPFFKPWAAASRTVGAFTQIRPLGSSKLLYTLNSHTDLLTWVQKYSQAGWGSLLPCILEPSRPKGLAGAVLTAGRQQLQGVRRVDHHVLG